MEPRHDRERDRLRSSREESVEARAGAGGRSAGPAARHPRRRRRILLAGAAGLGLVYWVGWQSPLTLVEHVVVDAPRGISAESIRLASGISAADRVPSVDPEAVRLGIMTAIPAVADVQLERSLPDTIRLAVTARTPLAAVEAGKGFYVMDAEGVVYDKVAQRQGTCRSSRPARTPSARSPAGSCWPSPRTCAPRSPASPPRAGTT